MVAKLVVAPLPAPVGSIVSVTGTGFNNRVCRVLLDGVVSATDFRAAKGRFEVGVQVAKVVKSQSLEVEQKQPGGKWIVVARLAPLLTFAPPSGADTTGPVISGISASSVSTTSHAVAWLTSEPASSRVEYGLTGAYGSFTTLDISLVTSHSATITGLAVGTLYHYRVISADSAGNSSTSADQTFTTAATTDVTIPVMSAIVATTSGTTATVTWTTDEGATGQVQYGATTSYGLTSALDSTYQTSHSHSLSSLTELATYHYRVRSSDASGNERISSDRTFTVGVPNAPTYPEMILARTGVVAAYFFGNDSGTTSVDEATGHNGTYSTAPTYGTTSPIPGDTETAVTLGTTQTMTIPAHADFDLGDGPFSIEFWANASTTGHTLIGKSDGATDPGWQIVNSTSLMRLQDGNGSNNVRQTTTASASWHHYVLTRDTAASGKVYIDGVDDTTVSAAVTFSNSTNDIVVGVNGAVYGLVIYNRVVTSAEAAESAGFSYSVVDPPTTTAYEGYGANVTGGGGLTAYVVNTTADSGAGSLRDALSAGSRYITFSVSGTINLLTQLNPTGNNFTIDGSTSTTGIVITGAPIFWSGNSNVIVTGLRFNDNDLAGAATADNMTLKSGANLFVIDHCSFDGATDGALDVTLDCSDVTVQWCIIGPNVLTHNNLMQIARSTENVSVHHNLFYEGQTRMPQCGDGDNPYEPGTTLQGDIRCNLIWAPSNGLYGAVIAAGAVANVVRNYYYLSVAGTNRRVHTETTGSAYSSGNYDRSGQSTAPATAHTEMAVPGYAVIAMEATAQLAAAAVVANAGARTAAGALDSRDQAKINAINAAGL